MADGWGEARWRVISVKNGYCGAYTKVKGWYLMHMRKTLYPFTGTSFSCLKMFANRSKPRPLLVVHSGNTTIGPRARFLTSSRLSCFSLSLEVLGGIFPVCVIMDQRETTLKPSTSA